MTFKQVSPPSRYITKDTPAQTDGGVIAALTLKVKSEQCDPDQSEAVDQLFTLYKGAASQLTEDRLLLADLSFCLYFFCLS